MLNHDEPDPLAYDGELGWIDPSDILGSLGVACLEGKDHLHYTLPGGGELRIPRRADWPLLRAILDDAEHRARTSGEDPP